MSANKIRVAVNGYGVIGKRIADAIAVQDDMRLVGVADVVSDGASRWPFEKGYAVFAPYRKLRGDERGRDQGEWESDDLLTGRPDSGRHTKKRWLRLI